MLGDDMDPEGRSGFDPRGAADLRLDQLRDSFPCRTCGSLEPAIIEGPFCSDCPDEGAGVMRRRRINAFIERQTAAIDLDVEDEDEPLDTNREGQPEFNGAFNA